MANHCALAGTSRNSGELGKFDVTTTSVKEFYASFKLKLVLARADEEQKKVLKAAIHNTDTHIFSTLGSICMHKPYEAMRGRFRQLSQLEKHCVLSLILLNEASIYQMTQPRIQAILCHVFKHGKSLSGAMLLAALGKLKDDGFIVSVAVSGAMIPEAAYITGEEAAYYYALGTNPENRKPENDMTDLEACLFRNNDADGLNGLALSRYFLGKKVTAIDLWNLIVNQFKSSLQFTLQEQVARALSNKGVALGELKRHEEAIACYTLVEQRYKDASESALQQQVARALFNKSLVLGELKRHEEAIACCTLLEQRYKDAPEPAIQKQVGRTLVNKGVALGHLKRHEEAIACYTLVEQRYKDAPEPALQEQVARALFNKSLVLGGLKRHEEAIACCTLAENRYKDAPEPALQEQVARALVKKGAVLMELKRHEEAIACFTLVEQRYKDAPEPALQEQVVYALFNKGIVLGLTGQYERTRVILGLLIERYRIVPISSIQKTVNEAIEIINRIDETVKGDSPNS